MLLRHRSVAIALPLLIITSLILLLKSSPHSRKLPAQLAESLKLKTPLTCPNKLDWLLDLDLTFPVTYARRDIIVNQKPEVQRASLTNVHETLFPPSQLIDLTNDADNVHLKHCEEPLRLDVPLFPSHVGKAAHVMFGISTTLDRLEASIPQLLRWLPNTDGRLFVITIEAEQEEGKGLPAIAADPGKKAALQGQMRKLGMDVTLVEPLELQDSFSEKYFSLVKIMYDHRNDKTKWISTIDDDTFFPTIPGLVSMLSKYDTKQCHYVGGVSEEWWAVVHYGIMGFGGAGVFLSLPLAGIIAGEYEYCKGATTATAGDIRIMECVYELTDIKLENERELHQIDMHGDLSGLFESGRTLLSVHHWKPGAATVDGYDLPMMHQVYDVCQDCFLQRWKFNDDLVLANGYSISHYAKDVLAEEMMVRMEQTWADIKTVEASNNRGADHSLGPTRPKLNLTEEKFQYVLIHSAAVDGGVRQLYLHERGIGDPDGVLELLWRQGSGEKTQPLGT
ncbi:MAG: hypothetical protein OHK93_003640 [Ramalina farinacea]|uniref:Glycosyltransferase family 31 protein n=1 Tax=Ramalina farinacea TaxID=258253 RepID=A0AA43QTL5_9LECA|nr:hypothetical protein [Ramalina farinacea]